MNEETLYRDESVDYGEFVLGDGGLDVEAWIRGSTYEIWDLQLAGRIGYYDDDDCVIHASDGRTVNGTAAIVADTLAWQSAFPDL